MKSGAKVGIGIGIVLVIFVIIGAIGFQADLDESIKNSPEIKQFSEDFNDAALDYLDICMNTYSIEVADNCKVELQKIKDQCNESYMSSLSVCNDPRLDDFYIDIDIRIKQNQAKIDELESNLSNAFSNMLDACLEPHILNPLHPDFSVYELDQCDITINTFIEENCVENPLKICNDERIQQYREARAK